MNLKIGDCLYIEENEDIYRYIKSLEAENKKYKEAFDKAIALVNDPWSLESGNEKVDEITVRKKKELLNILNG